MDDRRLTLIIVPHGDLETRTFEISYRRLKLLLTGCAIVLLVIVVMASSWWYVASQAARVEGLEREVATLEEERERVAELARTLAEVEAQYERVREMLGATSAAGDTDILLPPLRERGDGEASAAGETDRPDAWPLTATGYVTRALTDTDGGDGHPGIDIAVPQDTYIRAAGAGRVSEAGEDEIYGNYVLIDHENGYVSMYGHTSRFFVAPGDRVERHEVIALSGSTGRSTAPHLHFEVRRDGETVDPLSILRQP